MTPESARAKAQEIATEFHEYVLGGDQHPATLEGIAGLASRIAAALTAQQAASGPIFRDHENGVTVSDGVGREVSAARVDIREGDPWGDFLAETLSMDEMQVRLISMTPPPLVPSGPAASDEMPAEVDLRGGERGKYLHRYREWVGIKVGHPTTEGTEVASSPGDTHEAESSATGVVSGSVATGETAALRDALGVAAAAIREAIYSESGLDGDGGERALRLAVEALKYGTFDKRIVERVEMWEFFGLAYEDGPEAPAASGAAPSGASDALVEAMRAALYEAACDIQTLVDYAHHSDVRDQWARKIEQYYLSLAETQTQADRKGDGE